MRLRPLVEALEDYAAMAADEISFQRGDRLTVLQGGDAHWYWASLQGTSRAGFVPRALCREIDSKVSEREAAAACQLPPHFHRAKFVFA